VVIVDCTLQSLRKLAVMHPEVTIVASTSLYHTFYWDDADDDDDDGDGGRDNIIDNRVLLVSIMVLYNV